MTTLLVYRVAETLQRARPGTAGPEMQLWADLAVALATVLAEVDPAFDYGAFFTACGGL